MPKLTKRWAEWRRTRRAALLTDGATIQEASAVASKEARARQSVEVLVGRRAAEHANVIFAREKSGHIRTLLLGHEDELPSDAHREVFGMGKFHGFRPRE